MKPRTKEMINEAVDIILNTEEDKSAIAFLQETLPDDFPDLDLGRMDLHEASKVLEKSGRKNKKKISKSIEDLNKSFETFFTKDMKPQKKKKGNKRNKKKKTK